MGAGQVTRAVVVMAQLKVSNQHVTFKHNLMLHTSPRQKIHPVHTLIAPRCYIRLSRHYFHITKLSYKLFDFHINASHQAFPYLSSLIGIEGIFFLHSSTLLLGAAFALAALPETRNKSLTELEQIFVKKKQGQEEARCCS